MPDELGALRDLLEQRISANEKAVEVARATMASEVEARFRASQVAIDKAETQLASRLQQLADAVAGLRESAQSYVTQAGVAALLNGLDAATKQDMDTRVAIFRREFDLWREGLNERMRLINLATDKAAESMNLRLEGMNEFRDQLRDQAQNFVSRIELAALADKIDVQQSELDKGEGRRTVITTLVAAATSLIIGLTIGLVVYALNHH